MIVELKFLMTCNPGTEDVVAMEVLEEIPGARIIEAREGSGRVRVEAPEHPGVVERMLGLRSVHSIVLLLAEDSIGFDAGSLARIHDIVSSSSVEDVISRFQTFAVEAERIGEGHEYTSMDIARVVGDAVIRVVEARRGWRPEVRLNSPQVILYAGVEFDRFSLGVLVSGERSLHVKRYRLYDHPAALKSTLAYVMLRLSNARDGDVIVDPMCGGGTIAMEAALLYENSKIICMDLNPRFLKGALTNFIVARVERRIKVVVGDARRLTDYTGVESVDRIVTNPPYGIRMGELEEVRETIREFLGEALKALKPGGTLTIITPDRGYVISKAREAGFELQHARNVRHGDLLASIIVLGRG